MSSLESTDSSNLTEYGIGPPWGQIVLSTENETLLRIFGYKFIEEEIHKENTTLAINVTLNNALNQNRMGEANENNDYLSKQNVFFTTGEHWNGKFDFNSNTGEITVTKFSYIALETFLRQISIYHSLRSGYLPLHSVAFEYKGKTYICPGESGSGKSTISSLLKDDATVLSDELNIIGGTPNAVWSLPYRGTSPVEISTGGEPLFTVIFHKKAKQLSINPISGADAINEFSKNIVVPTFNAPETQIWAFNKLTNIVSSAKMVIVDFPKDRTKLVEALNIIGDEN